MTKNINIEKILKQVQNDKSVETGRSMTEMLGVLAIIGVLSIGGIAGYTYAMERHYTNEILNAASQRAVVIASQIAAGRQVSLTEFDGQKEVAGGTFDGTVEEWDDEFGIKVTGVKESVCQKLLKATEGTDIVLAKTDGADLTEADCAGGSFLITYSNDLGKSERPELDENGCYEVTYKTGYCCDFDKTVRVCPGDNEPNTSCTPNPPNGCSCENQNILGDGYVCDDAYGIFVCGFNWCEGGIDKDKCMKVCDCGPQPDGNAWVCKYDGRWECSQTLCSSGACYDDPALCCDQEKKFPGAVCLSEAGEWWCPEYHCKGGPNKDVCQSDPCPCDVTEKPAEGWTCDVFGIWIM